MTTIEMKDLREDIVRMMDDTIIRKVDDENLMDRWLTGGCPDCATDDDYQFIASDEKEFLDVVYLFVNIVRKAL